MKVLKEGEAVKYLSRLTNSLTGDYYLDEKPFSVLCSVFSVELAYFQRLMRQDGSGCLASLTVNSTGFPELESMAVDIKKAYRDLDDFQARVGKSVLPLFDQLENVKNLDRFDQGIDKIVAEYQADQSYIDLVKKMKDPVSEFKVKPNGWGNDNLYFFIDPKNPAALSYRFSNTTKAYDHSKGKEVDVRYKKEGYLKYIDSEDGHSVMFNYQTYTERRRGEASKIDSRFRVFGNVGGGIPGFWDNLNVDVRDRILSIDFTELPDGSLNRLVQSSSKLASVLDPGPKLNCVVKGETKTRRGLWRFVK